MRVPQAFAIAALGAALLASATARAQEKDKDKGKDDEAEEAEEGDGAAESSEETVVVDDAKPKAKPKEEFKKQDLRGHAVEESSATNTFEKDRFFVDKVDTKKTAKGTLIQGSIASSSFLYTERSGTYGDALGSAGSKFSRIFTDLRLQTDFRHIGGGKWDARIDTRARVVNDPAAEVDLNSVTDSHVQSGFNGTNEYEVREAWIVRSGKRSDLFFGRQFVPDLGALRIDGLRVDYAQSEKLTLIGFGGLYPVRGSRSITTDYVALKDDNGKAAGRLVGSGGFGLAYRTLNTHGALGGVAIVPFSSETPRIYATSNGYYRSGAKVDLYHMAIFDAFGKAAPALTNLSAGANYKPSQRLRLTASFNRVDTETLNVQANAFLADPAVSKIDPATGAITTVQNETFIKRLSTNAAKGGVSASLGADQRFEISTAVNYRYRPAFKLTSPDNTTTLNLAAAKGVDVFLALIDRRSIAKLRLGADVSRSFAIGGVSYQRSEVLAARVFAAREFKSGRGEWEAEVGYSTTKDTGGGSTMCPPRTTTMLEQCFGSSNGTILSLGGNVYYRINQDWFALGNLFLSSYGVKPGPAGGMALPADPTIFGLTGYFRIAYRF
jgi:hypothetical protein